MEDITFKTQEEFLTLKAQEEAAGNYILREHHSTDGSGAMQVLNAEEATEYHIEQNAIKLADTDKGMIRVVEDIWEALKAKGLVADADLPSEALDKMNARKALRSTG